MWEYTDKVKEHFLNPRNVGEIEDADGVGEVGSLACGDALTLYLKLDENERITRRQISNLWVCQRHRLLFGPDRDGQRAKPWKRPKKSPTTTLPITWADCPRKKCTARSWAGKPWKRPSPDYRGEARKKKKATLSASALASPTSRSNAPSAENSLTTIEDVTDYIKAGGGCGNAMIRSRRSSTVFNGKCQDSPEKSQTS